MTAYYNEFDKTKAAMLKQLMADGHITSGDIDDRPIQEVKAHELNKYTRCHFFAGIGLWDYALQLAGWPADKPVWTGSCPCQPFSTAGRQKAQADDRHLWPAWFSLIRQCKPSTVFGEQVASAIAKGWLDDVYQGMESEGYAVGSAVLPACSVGAPHRRERLWFVGYSKKIKRGLSTGQERQQNTEPEWTGEGDGIDCFVGEPISKRLEGFAWNGKGVGEQGWEQAQQTGSAWQAGVWIECPDGKARLIEPCIPLLAHGDSERVAIIHAAGDAIVPQVAAEFIKASMFGDAE